jgi:hypothetical protein
MNMLDADAWGSDWLWSLPLILSNIIIHVFGLALINDAVVVILKDMAERRGFILKFAETIGVAVLLIILLHTIEAATWAVVYWFLGALPDYKIAMLAWRHDQLWACQYFPASAVADDGRSSVLDRSAAVRSDHGFSVRHDPIGLAGTSEQGGLARKVQAIF